MDAPPSKSREIGCSFSACGRTFFWKGKALYRPSQDCSGRYGSAMVINRIDQLTPDVFQETIVARVEPRWRRGLSGMHTLNSCSGLTMIDFRHSRSSCTHGGERSASVGAESDLPPLVNILNQRRLPGIAC